MAYASSDDVETELGRALSSAESDQVEGWLASAAYLIAGYLRVVPADADPELLKRVSVGMVVRALTSAVAPGAASATASAGTVSRTVQFVPGASAGGVWLSGTDKTTLAPLRTPMGSLPLVSERSPD